MKTWSLSPGGVLVVSDDTGRFPATAEQIYASIVERTPEWEDMPAGKHGAATEVDFSAYPVDAVLVLHVSGDARPAIRLEARTQLNQSFQLSPEAIRHGHVVHECTWYPVSAADTHSITVLLRTLGLDPDAPDLTTLRQCLALRRAAANGEPVLDRLRDDIWLNLSSIEHGAGPEGIDATLYPYQVRGWQWLRFIISEQAGGLLADETGLGKTLQVISALSDHGPIPSTAGSLVVAPGSPLENWAREIAKFCPGLHAVKHHGPDRTGSPAELRPPDVIITSHETAIRDLPLLRMIRWHVVVLDEVQNIRNPDTRRAKAVKHLRREVSVVVTGTPVENRLRDVWSIMDFILPGYLGDLPAFEAGYADNDADASLLEPLVSPVILRRRVQEVAKDLPPRIDIPEILKLEADEAIAYEDVRAAIYREYGATATLVSLTRLRQFCARPALLGEPVMRSSFSATNTSTNAGQPSPESASRPPLGGQHPRSRAPAGPTARSSDRILAGLTPAPCLSRCQRHHRVILGSVQLPCPHLIDQRVSSAVCPTAGTD